MDDLLNSPEYLGVLTRVKRVIAGARQQAMLKVNSDVICMYWRVGAEILPYLDWGSGFIDGLARDIRSSYPGVKGFSARSLRYMAKFAREVEPDFLQQLAAKIPWGHIMLLLDKTQPGPQREWYARATIENGWSRAVLAHQLDSHLYERQALSGKVSNFTRTLPLLWSSRTRTSDLSSRVS